MQEGDTIDLTAIQPCGQLLDDIAAMDIESAEDVRAFAAIVGLEKIIAKAHGLQQRLLAHVAQLRGEFAPDELPSPSPSPAIPPTTGSTWRLT
jgi:hypothetical protein